MERRAADRRASTWLAVILLVQAASYAPELSSEFQFIQLTGRDDVEAYLALGHSLANGRGYTRSLDAQHFVPHKHWPPGFPLFLSVGFLFGDSLLIPQLLVAATALANSLLLWLLARRLLEPASALFVVAMFAFSPICDGLATHVMSEHLTAFCLMLTVWALAKWADGGFLRDRWALVAGIALAYGLLVRGLVLAVVPASWLYLIVVRPGAPARSARLARVTYLLTLALIPWLIWVVRGSLIEAPGYDGVTEFADREGPLATLPMFPQIAWNNLKWFFGTRLLDAFGGAGWLFDTYSGTDVPAWARIAVLALFGASCLVAWRRRPAVRQVILVLGFLLLMLLQRPSGGAPRYWVSVFPFVLIVVASAAESIRHATIVRATAFALVLGAFGGLVWDHAHRRPQDDPVWDSFVRICQAARQATPVDAVILSHNETAARIISHRPASFTDDDARFLHGEDRPGRAVYAIVPSAVATRSHHRSTSYQNLTSRASEVIRNDYYTLYALLPEDRADER